MGSALSGHGNLALASGSGERQHPTVGVHGRRDDSHYDDQDGKGKFKEPDIPEFQFGCAPNDLKSFL